LKDRAKKIKELEVDLNGDVTVKKVHTSDRSMVS